MSLVNLKKIKKPEVEVEDINNMTKEELLTYIIDSFRKYYDECGIEDSSKFAKTSNTKNFYNGESRGFMECERIVNEIKGRLNK